MYSPPLVIGLAAALFVCGLSSCANKSTADRRHASVTTQDGATVSGTVTASSASEVTLAGDDNITRNIPMKQVRSIDYGEAAAVQTAPPPQAAAEPQPALQQRPPEPAAPPPAREKREQPRVAAPRMRTYEVPAGTEISVRTQETIDSSKAVEGQSYATEVSRDVRNESGAVVIPSASMARLYIVSASQGGRFRGAPDLVLDLKTVSIHGEQYTLDAANIQQRGASGLGANKRTAEYTGGTAAVGAIIGAIAGGGRGAAIGAGAGAGAGALTQILTRGRTIRVPAETVLTFKLEQPLRVVSSR